MIKYNKNFVVKSHVHCSVSSELLQTIYAYGFSASDLLEFGIKFKLSEVSDYPVPGNYLSKRIQQLQEIIKEKTEELEKCKNKNQDPSGIQQSQA